MRILGANPLKANKSPMQGMPNVVGFPRKGLAAAGTINNESSGTTVIELISTPVGIIWTAPATTTSIQLIEGYGRKGDSPTVQRSWARFWETFYYRADGGVDMSSGGPDQTGAGYAPSGVYCDAPSPSDGVYTSIQTCYYYEQYENYVGGDRGISATAFDLAFPGLYYNESTRYTATYKNIAVIPKKKYTILPNGGLIKLTYKK